MKKMIIIATYNEKDNIEKMLAEVYENVPDVHVLVIDDNSPDKTYEIVENLAATKYSGKLFLIKRAGKLGLGTAYVAGFNWGLARDYDAIGQMDADFSHNPHDLERLYEACHLSGADIAIGSRYVTGVNVVNWPLSRVLLSYFASVYVRLITGMKIMDTTAGFICYNRKVLENINLDKIKFIGYAFQIEMKYRAFSKKYVLHEVPVIFTDRTKGQSKMSGSIIKEAVFGVLTLRIRNLFNRL